MDFTAIFCCYILLPYFASLVSPPQEAITCNALKCSAWTTHLKDHLTPSSWRKKKEEDKSSEEIPENSKVSLENFMYKFFQQKLDHYHFDVTTKWPQRYLVNDKYYDGNGVVFMRIGTDTDINSRSMQTGRWIEYCKKAAALCVGIEYRGHGKSLPNNNIEDENLKYLNSEQALADLAWFIYNFRDLKVTDRELPKKLKWLAYGRSRGGALATWLRMKFPHLVLATLSLGAPLLAKEEFDDFYKLIQEDMLNKEQTFKNALTKSYNTIIKQIEHKHDYKKTARHLNFCKDTAIEEKATNPEWEKNTEFMYLTFAQAVASVLQYGEDVMKFVKTKVYNIMTGSQPRYTNLNELERFNLFLKWVSKTNKIGCLNIDYKRAISMYKTNTYNGYVIEGFPLPETFGDRATLFQSCNEFGQFQTYKNFFGKTNPLQFFTEFCHEVFGELSTKELLNIGVRKTNVFYGGLNIVVSNVIFVHGNRDPYGKLGIINENPGNSVTHILEGARHCDELDDFEVTQSLNEIKEKIYSQLMEWVELSKKSESIEKNDEKEDNAKVKGDEIVENAGNTEKHEVIEQSGKGENSAQAENIGNHEVTEESGNSENSAQVGNIGKHEVTKQSGQVGNIGNHEVTEESGNSENSAQVGNIGKHEVTEESGNSENSAQVGNIGKHEVTEESGNSENSAQVGNIGKHEVTEESGNSENSAQVGNIGKHEVTEESGNSENSAQVGNIGKHEVSKQSGQVGNIGNHEVTEESGNSENSAQVGNIGKHEVTEESGNSENSAQVGNIGKHEVSKQSGQVGNIGNHEVTEESGNSENSAQVGNIGKHEVTEESGNSENSAQVGNIGKHEVSKQSGQVGNIGNHEVTEESGNSENSAQVGNIGKHEVTKQSGQVGNIGNHEVTEESGKGENSAQAVSLHPGAESLQATDEFHNEKPPPVETDNK